MVAFSLALVMMQGLVPNGTFETIEGGSPSGWTQRTWNGKGQFGLGEGRSGTGVVLSSTAGADISWSCKVPVQPKTWYKLTGYVKTENVVPDSGAGALFNVHELSLARTTAVTGTAGWTKLETTFRVGTLKEITINCLFGGWGTAKGKATFDDLTLEPVDVKQTELVYEVDADKVGHPISPYIYGQFTEHLGRCIQGGIWAEMLEDRKFHFPVTTNFSPWQNGREPEAEFAPVLVASPWKIVSGDVKMVPGTGWTDQPVPQLNGAIEQPSLALQKGREYVGRVVLAGSGKATLSLGSFSTTVDAGSAFKKFPFKLKSDKDTDNAALRIASEGPVRIAAVSLMPADNLNGFRKDVVEKLRELNSPIYRWPGGNFASGYEWRDGLGDPDKRPSPPNPAWTGVETNDVGIHEFIEFCRLIKTEPLVVANTGFGDPMSAAQWVEYCNGATSTPMGALRATNGSPKPFGVKWWGIGNEMFGSWQLGYMDVNQYVLKHNQTVNRMKAVDPNILTVGVGAEGGWDRVMIPQTKDHMTLLSQHHYWQERADPYDHIMQARSTVSDLARYSRNALKGTDLKIAFDEYNYWYGPHVFGELGTRYFQKDGLGIAAALHEMFRNSDIFEMALYAQTVNVIGALKATRTTSFFETTGLVLKQYRELWGERCRFK